MSGEAIWLRERLEELERIERPSASDGERQAAEWLVAQFAEMGAEARIEAESANGTFWWSLGIGAALGVLGAALTLRGRRLLGALLGLLGAAGIADDFPPNQRRLRRLLPRRTTYNVSCELGDPAAERTIVFIAHHDAPHSGLVFHPKPPQVADKLGLIERTNTSPPLMAPVIGGPLLAALGAITGRRGLAKLGGFLGLGTVAAMADIGLRPVVPGANDNGAACVVLLALAKRFADEPPEGVRVILLSTGSEESFSEGMKAWGERHFPELSKEGTLFLCLEALGSDHLLVLRGEGFLKMNEYSPRALAYLEGLAEEMGIWLFPDLRLRNGTDGLESLAAGYETAVLRQLQRPQAGLQLPLAHGYGSEHQLRHRRNLHLPPPRDRPAPEPELAVTGGGGGVRRPLPAVARRTPPPPPRYQATSVTNYDYANGLARYRLPRRAYP